MFDNATMIDPYSSSSRIPHLLGVPILGEGGLNGRQFPDGFNLDFLPPSLPAVP